MKRSAALASLSRDHHQALVVAQRLRRAGEAAAPDARAAFLAYWNDHGRRHFRLEEEIVLPGYSAHGDAHHPLVLRALGDHVEIRGRANCLAGEPAAPPDALRELGEALAAHVRLEERELFPLIESVVPKRELAALAEALERAESAG
ncbi:MAG: hemerythrin domain-containing protein [Thermoleophilaceae bacterium]|nr:hemerythrin domain-containing protein [Thermoleophilaceae bacterium]